MRLPYMTLLACSLATAACGGDSTAPPEPDEFDPVALQAGVDRILNGNAVPELSIFNEGIDEIADYFGGIGFIASRGPIGARATRLSASVTAFPEAFKGLTYEWVTAEDQYDDTAALGAPATGTRFLVYEVNGLAFAEPLIEAGYIDLLDVSHGPAVAVRLLAEIDGATQADITAASTGTLQDGTLGLVGFFGTGAGRVEFDVDAVNTVTADGTASTYMGAFAVPGNDLNVAVETDVDRTPALVTYSSQISIVGPGGAVELDGDFDGETFAGVARVNGTLYANITFEGAGAPVVIGAGEVVLTNAQEQLLARSVELLQAPPDFLDALLPPFLFPLEVEPGDA